MFHFPLKAGDFIQGYFTVARPDKTQVKPCPDSGFKQDRGVAFSFVFPLTQPKDHFCSIILDRINQSKTQY